MGIWNWLPDLIELESNENRNICACGKLVHCNFMTCSNELFKMLPGLKFLLKARLRDKQLSAVDSSSENCN